MSTLHLDSLEIKNFRTFKHLTIEKLGRINLIVGKNSVGKTALLESLWLYAARNPSLIWEILQRHDEASDTALIESRTENGTRYRVEMSQRLFHGYGEILSEDTSLEIGDLHLPEKHFSLTRLWTQAIDSQGQILRESPEPSLYHPAIPVLTLKINDIQETVYPLDRSVLFTKAVKPVPHVFIGAEGFTSQLTEFWWEKVALTSREELVLKGLNLIEPIIQRIAFVNRNGSSQNRYPLVKTSRFEEPVPLRTLGEGYSQLFQVTLALVNSQDGFCLIDEIEMGLHYTTLHQLWELIFRVADELNIQVFATTHSDDCVSAFQYAAKENEQVEGQLIRLEQWNGQHTAIVLDEKDLETSIKYKIETR